jgi:serine/threonine-protein kinase
MNEEKSPAFSRALIGTDVADYHVESVIGWGGMSEVYRARDKRLGRLVALKILASQLATDERFRQRFVRESRMVASIDHPHIIPIYEAGESGGLLFIAMRYVEGRDLRALLDEEGPLPLARANRILTQVAAALDAAHRHGLVHRDVKPANILVTGDPDSEHTYLTDFGLTKNTDSLGGLTSQGQFMGTPRYVAPEQITGEQVDPRADVYAFGCVTYEVLTGMPPFQRDSQLALLYAHLSETPPPLTSLRPELPPAADEVMQRALAKTPDDRFDTCMTFVQELRDALSGASGPYAQVPAQSAIPNGRAATSIPPHVTADASAPRPSHAAAASYTAAPRPAAVSRARFWRSRRFIIVAAVLVVAVLAGVFFVMTGGERGWQKYPSSVAAPFTFKYPGSWQARTHSDLYAVASPDAGRFEKLFETPISSDWTAVADLVRSDPDRAQGVFAGVSDTLSTSGSADEMQQGMQYLLPGTVGYSGSPSPQTVGGRPAFKLVGVLSDPQQRAQLNFRSYIIRGNGSQAPFLTLFCAPGHCDQGTMDQIVDSVSFTPG